MDNNSEIVYLYLDDIIPNRFQPREVFDDQALKELAVSIKEHGVIQPIIVRKVDNKYEIIAGERRYKASTMAGLTKIPAIVKNLDDKESSKVALIENLQRKDLSPIEEARTYQKILELEDDMTQEQLAATLGKTQSSVSNKLRLLALPEEVQDALLKDKISERHARSLLNIEDKNEQIKMMDRVINEKMTVRELDKEIKILKGEPIEEEKHADIKPVEDVYTTTGESSKGYNFNGSFNPFAIKDSTEGSGTEPTTSAPTGDSFTFPFALNEKESLSANDILNEDQSSSSKSINDAFAEIKKSIEEAKISRQEGIQTATEPTEQKYSFVPTFGMNSFGGNKESTDNTNASDKLSSNVGFDTLTVAPSNKDIEAAVVDIKGTLEKIREDGFNITIEESDEGAFYKLVITINKDA